MDSAVRTRHKTSPDPGCCFLSPVSVSLAAAGSNITTVLVSGHEDNIGHNIHKCFLVLFAVAALHDQW